MVADLTLDFLDRDFALRRTQNIGKAILGQFHCDGFPDQGCKSEKANQGAFEDANVRGNPVRKKFQHTAVHFQARIVDLLLLNLRLQNAKPQFVIRWVKVHHQPTLQS